MVKMILPTLKTFTQPRKPRSVKRPPTEVFLKTFSAVLRRFRFVLGEIDPRQKKTAETSRIRRLFNRLNGLPKSPPRPRDNRRPYGKPQPTPGPKARSQNRRTWPMTVLAPSLHTAPQLSAFGCSRQSGRTAP
jgi:hypothetical protein